MKTRILAAIIFVYSLCAAQNVISINDAGIDFTKRWNEALAQMAGSGTIIYAIEKTNSHHRSSAEKFTIFELLNMSELEAKSYTFFVFNANNQNELVDMTIADGHSRIEYQDTIYWLGETDPSLSLEHVISKFNTNNDKKLRKDLVIAVGVHPGSERSLKFLAGIIEKYPDSLAKEAVFWIGQSDDDRAVDIIAGFLK
jgi:hypothetical protein